MEWNTTLIIYEQPVNATYKAQAADEAAVYQPLPTKALTLSSRGTEQLISCHFMVPANKMWGFAAFFY